jgi:hypothetical protein
MVPSGELAAAALGLAASPGAGFVAGVVGATFGFVVCPGGDVVSGRPGAALVGAGVRTSGAAAASSGARGGAPVNGVVEGASTRLYIGGEVPASTPL